MNLQKTRFAELLVTLPIILVGLSFSHCSKDESTNPVTNGGTTTTSDGWTVQIVEEKNGTQYVNTINGDINAVIDNQGNIHISYFDGNASAIKYATNKSGAWTATTLETSIAGVSIVGEMNDIAVDQSGNAHLSYHNMDNNVSDANVETIRYATNASGSWVKSNVLNPAANNVFAENEICVDVSGTIHIVYEGASSSIGYSRKTTGAWTTETAAQFPAFTTDMNMVLDQSGLPTIAYTGNYGLYVTKRITGASWQGSLIVGNANVNENANFPAIAVGPTGTQYVVYQDLAEDKIWLSTNGALTQLSANAGKGFFSRPAITIDGNGKYHIAYCTLNTSDWTLHYVTNKTGIMVDTPLTIRTGTGTCAICVDNSGKVFLIYPNTPRGSLICASK